MAEFEEMHPSCSKIALPLLVALTSVACTLSTASTASDAPASGTGAGTADTRDAQAPLPQIDEVALVGTGVTSAIHTTGSFDLTTLPSSALHAAVLDDTQAFEVVVSSPSGIELETPVTKCTPAAPAAAPPIFGVIVDDSAPMAQHDPQNRRRDATIQFINTLTLGQTALLADIGPIAFTMRNLLREQTVPNSCPLLDIQPMTGDKAALIDGTARIRAEGPDDLFNGCAYMARMVGDLKDRRSGILILSNGKPDGDIRRDDCQRNDNSVPLYTVGIGPADEDGPDADPVAVAVLRETSAASGGSYASVNRPDLDAYFRNVGAAVERGSCKTTTRLKAPALLQPGTKVKGEIIVGTKGARAPFTFVAPAR